MRSNKKDDKKKHSNRLGKPPNFFYSIRAPKRQRQFQKMHGKEKFSPEFEATIRLSELNKKI